MQKGLKILSGLCLLFVSFSFLWFPLTVFLDGGDLDDALIITAFAVPGITAFVASYRQFFKPQRGLIIALVIFIVLMTIALFLLFQYLGNAIGDFNEMTGPKGPKMPDVMISTGEILTSIASLYLAMIIPIIVNFRMHRK